MKHTLAVVTEDKPGVLARVASLCARRGFNIHSLAVGPIHEPGRSRITLVVDADQVEQVTKQLHKLVHVTRITELPAGESVEREVMLCRVNGSAKRREVLDAAAPFQANVVDASTASVTFEMSGHPDDLASFYEAMRPYGVIDLVKSGRIAIARDKSTANPPST